MLKSNQTEIRPLTSLRAVAALLVFVSHFSELQGQSRGADIGQALAIEGHIGVTIFFVLSGFLFTLRYYQPSVEGRLNLYDYFTNRAARIYPVYFFILFITLFYRGVPLFTNETLANWTLTQGFFFRLKFTGIGTAWSLTTEECFYLITPLIFLSLRSLSRKRLQPVKELSLLSITLGMWVVVFAGLGVLLMVLSASTGLAYADGFMNGLKGTIYMTIFFRLSHFAVGIFCARYYQRVLSTADRRITISRALLFISIIGILVSVWLMNQNGGIYEDGWIYNYFVAVFAGALILALTCEALLVSKVLSLPICVYFGRISYVLYLIQFTPIVDPLETLPVILKYLSMNVISAFLYEVIEKPGSRLVKRLSSSLKGYSAVAG